MDLATLIARLLADGSIPRLSANVAAQFGSGRRRLLGAEIMPERLVPENSYKEEAIRYRTVIANDGTRYSPTQLKKGELIGSFLVTLAESDIARELTGAEYDALLRFLQSNQSMDAMATILRWLDTTVNQALIENIERQRWEAIVDASVTLRGDNEYSDTIAYSNPTGHRVNAGAQWSDDANDPFDDILAQADFLATKGFTVGRMVTSRAVASILANNEKVKQRVGPVAVTAGGQLAGVSGRATLAAINGVLSADGLPAIETYDLQYRTSNGSARFLKADAFVMIAETGRDENLDLGDTEVEIVPDTLGYAAVGRPAGQSAPGRFIRMERKEDKPPRLEAEGWQTALPVITEPEAVSVIKSIT